MVVTATGMTLRPSGAVICRSSVLALAPEMFDGVYSTTKTFLLSLSQSMATQLRGKDIHIQTALPRVTRTTI